MTSKQIDQIIIDKMTEAKGPFTAYAGGNWSYISCDECPELLPFLLLHPEFSHWSQRSAFSISVYWHCEGSPTGVCSVGSFDPSREGEAYDLLKDPISKALAGVW